MTVVNRLLSGVLGLIVAGTLVIAFVVAPESAGASYWLSVLWVVILILGNWVTSAVVFRGGRDGVQSAGSLLGVLPAVGGFFLLYSLISCCALAVYHLGVIGTKLHAVVQILGLVGFCSIILTSLTAPTLANSGMTTKVSQSDLLSILDRWRRASLGELGITSEIDLLANEIKFRTPHLAKLDQDVLLRTLDYMKSIEKPRIDDLKEVRALISSA